MNKLNRRDFLQRAAILGAAMTGGAAFLAGCKQGGGGGGNGLSCTDTSGMSAADIQTRTMFNYVDQTPNAAQPCSACALWLPGSDAAGCGGCTLVKGPINPNGWCSSFAARPA